MNKQCVEGCNWTTLFSVLGGSLGLGKQIPFKSNGLSKRWVLIKSEKNKHCLLNSGLRDVKSESRQKNAFLVNMYTRITGKFQDSSSIRSWVIVNKRFEE